MIRMHKFIISTLLLAILIGSCAPAPASPTQPPPATATQTIIPTRTPRPTQTSIPTATPYPPLKTDGPYLLFTYDNKNFTIMEADGSGRKQFQLPNEGYIWQLGKSVSPNGKWLGYFTGSIEEPYDTALNIFDLSDGTTQHVSNLLAPGFPANLDPIVETMVLGDPPIYHVDCFEDMECRRSLVERELTNSLFVFGWSPDSQSLAFTAQIDGASSDIYIYNLQDKSIHQLTNEPLNIFSIDWAPNGQRILYEVSSPLGNISDGREFHLVNLDGGEIPFTNDLLYKYLHWSGNGWISENTFLLHKWSDSPPHHGDFKILNTDTGQVKDIWHHWAEFFALDHENKAVYLTFKHYYDSNSLPAEGIYIVDLNGNFRKISDWQLILIESRGPYQVLGQDYERQVYDIKYDGSIEPLAWSGYPFPLISPDGKLLLYRKYKKLALYADSYQPIKSWQIEEDIYKIAWRPDSLGLFIFTNKNANYLSMPDGEPRPLLDDCSPKQCEFLNFIWLHQIP